MSAELLAARKALRTRVVDVKSCVVGVVQSALSVNRETTATISLTIARTNYRGAVTLAVTGLPTGVAASWSPVTKDATAATITLTAATDATLVTDEAFTVTATTPFGAQTFDCTLTVNASTNPTIASVSPAGGDPDATRAVTITGTNYVSGATVSVSGTAATSVVVVNATTITCTLPAKSSGRYNLTVVSNGGSVTATGVLTYGAVPFFADNLQGGQFNNAGGFTWSLGGTFWSVSADRGVNGGTHSFKGTYTARDASQAGEQGSGDLNFNMGRDCNEFAVEWYVYVPENYFHRDRVAGSDNNKWFGIFRDIPNNNDAWRAVLEANRDPENVGGSLSRIAAAQSNLGTVIAQNQNPGTGVPMLNTTGATMAVGTWNRIRWYSKFSSADGVNDGVIKVWFNDTLLEGGKTDGDYWQERRDLYPTPAVNLGYFMGACNSGYNEATTFYVADFKFFDTNPGW